MIDILFPSWNRPEFSAESLGALAANTDWSHVRRLIVYTDGAPMREGYVARPPIPLDVLEYNCDHHGGPVAITNHYLRGNPAAWFAKLDNDTVVPPGWLVECLTLLENNPAVDLLGIEPMHPVAPAGSGPRSIVPAKHIGGIGLMRTAAFTTLPAAHGRMGFTSWQVNNPQVVKAWIDRALPVILLDRMPFEPWVSLSKEYEAAGWQRPWQKYGPEHSKIWEWWKR